MAFGEGAGMKIILLGDSTIQTYGADRFPQTGWGQVFPRFVRKEIPVLNFGKGGASSKSFYEQGYFGIAKAYIEAGDFVFIQFGHNDQKPEEYRRTEPYTTYQECLKRLIDEARELKAQPLLLSSVYRRHFDSEGHLLANVHGEYPVAMESLAKKEEVPFIDVCRLSADSLHNLGEEESRKLYMFFGPGIHPNYPEGSSDNTHLSYLGAFWIAGMVATELKTQNILTECLI
jgi:lysophospholipase L1-like esterase